MQSSIEPFARVEAAYRAERIRAAFASTTRRDRHDRRGRGDRRGRHAGRGAGSGFGVGQLPQQRTDEPVAAIR